MINDAQCRAARALLNWSLQDLANRSAVSYPTIQKFEAGGHSPSSSTIAKITETFIAGGIAFTAAGAEIRSTPVYEHTGRDWYLKLLDDAYNTVLDTNEPEILIENVNDRLSPPEVVSKMRKIRDSEVAFRMTTKAGETYLSAPSSCYRFIPEQYFKNWIVMIFGDKVAFSVNNEEKCLVVEDRNMASAMRNRFNLVWDVLPELKIKSTANERI